MSFATDECNKEELEMQQYIDSMVKQGYINKDGAPLMCTCGSKDFYQCGEFYDEQSLVEYEVKCSSCGKRVGYFAYGTWEIKL